MDLEVTGVTKAYGATPVLAGIDLAISSGEFVAVLGPSGSGKTTLLRVIAGFERADAGVVRVHGETVDDAATFVPAERRHVGYVPQEGSLFPHLNVAQNVGFGLSRRERRGERVTDLLSLVGLADLGRRYPHELSGGQQQRVALARGLAIDPRLVLLDEPFSSLDAGLRAAVRTDVRRVIREAGATAVLVTHDQDEALSLADRVAVIRDGRIAQCDTPERLYAHPASPDLARQFGEVNLLAGTARDGRVVTALGDLEAAGPLEPGAVLALVRPEQVVVGGPAGPAYAEVLDTEFYGHDAVVRLRPEAAGAPWLLARVANPSRLPARGERVAVSVAGPVVAWPTDPRVGALEARPA
ncbi:MAG TPA: ABC transporter ATP-binding protein [Acidimicrobiales bacterium]|nr:ABC transporter ATP-binding protein [Acidimicrobiales bacterium]